MLYLFYGFDNEKKRKAIESLVSKLFDNSKLETELFIMNDIDFDKNKIETLIITAGLFKDKIIVILENILEEKEHESYVLDKIKEFSSSLNVFIIIANVISKKIVDKFTKYATEVNCFELSKNSITKNTFNIFSLTDAFGRRDKKGLWILFQKALSSEIVPEEILQILFWQTKMMILSKTENSESNRGINPFVLKKSSSFTRNFTEDELSKISSKLVSIFHQNRTETRDLNIDIEKLILEVI